MAFKSRTCKGFAGYNHGGRLCLASKPADDFSYGFTDAPQRRVDNTLQQEPSAIAKSPEEMHVYFLVKSKWKMEVTIITKPAARAHSSNLYTKTNAKDPAILTPRSKA
jgi:hypothetical protein